MLALCIKKGTAARVIKDGAEWYEENFRDFTTTMNLMFFREEIAVDPIGSLATASTKHHVHTIGGWVARQGYYGFRRGGFCLLVHANDVETC